MRYLITGLALLVASSTAMADEVHLKSGGKLEGRVKEEGGKIVLETMTGVVTLSEDDIVKIDRSHTSDVETYFKKLDEIKDSKDARAFLELAIWVKKAKGNRFSKEVLVHAAERIKDMADFEAIVPLADASKKLLGKDLDPLWNRVISLDSTNETARRALGYHLHEGKWVSEEEWHVARGNVKFEGKWISAEERTLILKERELKLEKRAKVVARKEKDVKKRESTVDRKLKIIEDALARLEREKQQLDRDRKDVERREGKVAAREREFARYTYHRACDSYYTGTHVCRSTWFYDKPCGGWFQKGHKCPKK